MVKYRVVDEYGYPYVIPEEQIFKTLEEMKTAIIKEFGLEKWESIVKYYVGNSLKYKGVRYDNKGKIKRIDCTKRNNIFTKF